MLLGGQQVNVPFAAPVLTGIEIHPTRAPEMLLVGVSVPRQRGTDLRCGGGCGPRDQGKAAGSTAQWRAERGRKSGPALPSESVVRDYAGAWRKMGAQATEALQALGTATGMELGYARARVASRRDAQKGFRFCRQNKPLWLGTWHKCGFEIMGHTGPPCATSSPSKPMRSPGPSLADQAFQFIVLRQRCGIRLRCSPMHATSDSRQTNPTFFCCPLSSPSSGRGPLP